jgi:uncharacterized protein
MKHWIFALALVCAAPAAAQEAETRHPALFVARDADSTMYLYGTVHVLRPGTPWGGPRAEAALAEAAEVWTEVEIDDSAQAQVATLMMQYGRAPEGRGLSTWLTTEENARLQALLKRLNAPPAMFEPMRPWLAGLMLTVLPMVQAGYDPDAGVDQAIDGLAEAAGKRMRSFETVEQQIGFIANTSDEAQREMLLDAIDQGEDGAAELDVLAEAWARGDLDTLTRVVADETRAEFPEMYDVMLKRRNDAWVGVLVTELEGSGVDFVAVGAGHIVSDDGLVAQLRARGYSVERVE